MEKKNQEQERGTKSSETRRNSSIENNRKKEIISPRNEMQEDYLFLLVMNENMWVKYRKNEKS